MKTIISKILCVAICLMTFSQVSFTSYTIQVGDITRTVSDNGIMVQDFDAKKNTVTKYDGVGRLFQMYDANGIMVRQDNYDTTGTRVSVMQYNPTADKDKAYSLTVFCGPGGRDSITVSGFSAADLSNNAAVEAKVQAAYSAFLSGGLDALNALSASNDMVKKISGLSISVSTMNGMNDASLAKMLGLNSTAANTADMNNLRRAMSEAGNNGSFTLGFTSSGGKLAISTVNVTDVTGLPLYTKDYTAQTVADYNATHTDQINAQLSAPASSVMNASAALSIINNMTAAQKLLFMNYIQALASNSDSVTTNDTTFANMTKEQLTGALTAAGVTMQDADKDKLIGAMKVVGAQGWGNALAYKGGVDLFFAGFKALGSLAQRVTDAVAKIQTMSTVAVQGNQIQLDFSQDASVTGQVGGNNATQNVVTIMLRTTGSTTGGVNLETYNGSTIMAGAAAWNGLSPDLQTILKTWMTNNRKTIATITAANITAALGSANISSSLAESLANGLNGLAKIVGTAGTALKAADLTDLNKCFNEVARLGYLNTIANLSTERMTALASYMIDHQKTFTNLSVDDIAAALTGTNSIGDKDAQAVKDLCKAINELGKLGVGNNSTTKEALTKVFTDTKATLSLLNGSYGNAHNLGSYDPLVAGKIQSVVNINGKNYVVVKADKIDMFDGRGFQAADGEEIYVEVDAATAANIQSGLASGNNEIIISGNVQADVNGHLTMSMNDGGYKIGTNAEQVTSEWFAQNSEFYKSMVNFMAANVWSQVGVQSDWRTGWNLLRGIASGQINF
ncbi:MAG: hypothetical protein LHV68_00640 [Elusimicrobia bacterium]|nr:hypothetical protein [Candidatus Liberimonas magnetica]